MKKIINKLRSGKKKHVLIVGDVMLDEYLFGTVQRISPEAPVPVVQEEERSWCLGGAANVAANCHAIGFDVSLVGVVGNNDQAGQRLVVMLENLGISTNGMVKSSQRVTTSKQRIMSKNHQLLRIDAETSAPLSVLEAGFVRAKLDALIRPGSIILISDYAKGVVWNEVVAHLVAQARALGCIIMVDPKWPNFGLYRHVDFIKPNLKEFNQMVEHFKLNTADSLEDNARKICDLLGLRGIFVTRGEQGILFVDHDRVASVPACRKEVYDLTGAGDTVVSFIALGLACGLSIEECLLVANNAAAVAVSHLKTYAVSLDELIDRQSEPAEKVFQDWASLKIELDWQRLGSKKVVFTNGCFDLIHSGHIHTLKEAKKLGDILVVGVNSDASIKRYKGPSRPINGLDERMAVIAALGVVDFVIAFEQDTPKELIEYLKPNVLAKGGDYQAEQIAGYDFMVASGGAVKIIDYLPGRSTTGIISSVNQRISK